MELTCVSASERSLLRSYEEVFVSAGSLRYVIDAIDTELVLLPNLIEPGCLSGQ